MMPNSSKGEASESAARGLFSRWFGATNRRDQCPSPNRLTLTVLAFYWSAIAVVVFQLSASLFVTEPAFALPLNAIVVALVVFTIWRWPGALILLGLQAYLLFFESAQRVDASAGNLAWIVGLALLLIVLVCRVRMLMERFEIRGIQGLYQAYQHSTESEIVARNKDLQLPNTLTNRTIQENGASDWEGKELAKGAQMILLSICGVGFAVAIALLGWWMVPLGPRAVTIRELRLTPNAVRAIQLAFLFAVPYLVVRVFIGEWLWRRISPAEAQVYLRSQFTSWIGPDTRFRVRTRARVLRKLESKKKRERSAQVDRSAQEN